MRKAVKWYSRGLFPPAATTVLLLLTFLAAETSISAIKTDGPSQFISLMEYIFFPVYGILIGSHVFRDSRTTIFELSIFNGPRTVFMARTTIVALGLIPGIGGVALLAWWKGHPEFVVPTLIKIPLYTAFITALMVYLDSLAGTLTLFIITSAIPMSFSVLLGKPGEGPVNVPMTALAYVFSPMLCVRYEKVLSFSSIEGSILGLLVSAGLFLWGYWAFSRREFTP
ncbi:hypothetical protein [Thermococcus waiotapuensis]|uniref:Uncharacterized protein n=1 Tax=Thermococcus waiotapuensis TaxID=90909 RepID=A0AAE4NVA8_9EURY|nr:hypothetical protein [Thermococcus waiotapuensis]MDV3103322.1 hypothetical protein [Thermococcus waiotapuensis]